VQLEDARLISSEDVQRVIGLLKATFTHMIIDTSKSFSRLDMMAMEMADYVLLVTQLDLPCLRNVVRLLMSFEEMGKLKEKTKIIVNRLGRETGQISLKKAQETIGKEIFWQVPNDYRVMVEVRNNGVPLIEHAPKAAITQNLADLAQRISGSVGASEGDDDESGEGKSGRKWLSLFGK
jgi:pilus assembly protein CpaE